MRIRETEEGRGSRRARAAVVLLCCLAAAAVAAGRASGEWYDLRAESFVAKHDVGTPSIHKVNCSRSEDGQAVDGMNLQGEWFELALTVPETWCFVDSLGSLQAGQVARYYVTFRREEEVVLADSVVTDFGGTIACKPADWRLSRRAMCIEPGEYRVRVELVTYGTVRVDGLHLRLAALPVIEPTWGWIKSLYIDR